MEGGGLEIEVEVAALESGVMGRGMEEAARRIAAFAALSDAVLEMKVSRTREPREAPAEVVRELYAALSDAGFSVRTDVLWDVWGAEPEGEVWVGAGGDGGRLRGYVEGHPAWKAL